MFADPLCLRIEDHEIKRATETLRENKGTEWGLCVSIRIQVGGDVELRDNLIPLLVETYLPTSTISNLFGLSGREVWAIAGSEPVSLFWCLDDCGMLLGVRDRRDRA